MEKKVVFGLLILCGIVSQGICTSSEKNEKSSDFHIRNKRLVGRIGHILEAPFLVSLITSGINHCPATLLTKIVAITTAKCFEGRNMQRWFVKSGLTLHEVMQVIQNGFYNSEQLTFNNLALVVFHPQIDYSHNRPIKIYNGTLAAQHLSVYNWAHQFTGRPRCLSTSDIQVTNVKLEELQYCVNQWPGHVGPDNLCAKSVIRREHCENFDYGAPLVITQQLVGIFATRGSLYEDLEIFMNLCSRRVKNWIHNYLPELGLL